MDDGGGLAATRRGVLAGTAALLGFVSAARARALSAGRVPPAEGAASPEIRRWAGCVGERFGHAGGALRLVSVEPGEAGGRRPRGLGRRQEFVAIFEAAGGAAPDGDAIYALSHPSLGRAALYLGAKQHVSGRARFVAAFN